MKRLIVCCDGTWQDLDNAYPTNVVKIARAIQPIADDHTPQLLYYSEGIGTRSSRLNKLFGGAFGWGIDQRIQNAYRFLCCNYEVGDEIYLFGFSRGAYTARSLAGLIYNCGLLQRRYIRKTNEAYRLYRDRKIKPSHEQSKTFRETYAVHLDDQANTQVPITLLGCWDTVGSMGVPNTFPLSRFFNQKYRFHDTRLNPQIQHALHAVAIDEHRQVFDVTHMRSHESRQQQVTEVWFPGNHGCVGGGDAKNRGLSDGALQWMIDQIKNLRLGLQFDTQVLNEIDAPDQEKFPIQPNALIPFEQKTGIFNLILNSVGYINRSLLDKHDEENKRRLDAGDIFFLTRFFEDKIHESVKERWQSSVFAPLYRPQIMQIFKKWFDEIVAD